MSVLELCDREIAAVPLDATVADAINKMLDHHVGALRCQCQAWQAAPREKKLRQYPSRRR